VIFWIVAMGLRNASSGLARFCAKRFFIRKKMSYVFFALLGLGGRRVWVPNYSHWLALGLFLGVAFAGLGRVGWVLFLGRCDGYFEYVDAELNVLGFESLGGDVIFDGGAGSYFGVKAEGLDREGCEGNEQQQAGDGSHWGFEFYL
jgi:hypothetical protein